ncbi:endo-1,3;1,4-beta-D-glucanase-like [Rhododendron vialii]|uniref:endo-1,3;1,4-beta-D-glucanase-like n=1 Tax=Rhododendron vialii TaxID=182163 RepID=UPI00265F241D|nr:endo-1,3;1,4-beta-D-glucanase-like [Rhododendron vialii]
MANAQCCANAPTLSSTCGAGHVEEFGGLKNYISGPSDSKLAILLVSDVFGYEAPNLRLLADKCAAAGYLVTLWWFQTSYMEIPLTKAILIGHSKLGVMLIQL